MERRNRRRKSNDQRSRGCSPVAILFAVRISSCALCAIVAKPPQAFINIYHHTRPV